MLRATTLFHLANFNPPFRIQSALQCKNDRDYNVLAWKNVKSVRIPSKKFLISKNENPT